MRALLVFGCLPWAAGAAGCINGPVPSMPVEPEQPAAEPPAEMIGEQWQSPGVPPPRDPGVPWYHRLPLDDAWRELAAPHNQNAALVTFKRAERTVTPWRGRGGSGPATSTSDARGWHNGIHAIRVKVHYLVAEPNGVDCNMPSATVQGWYPT